MPEHSRGVLDVLVGAARDVQGHSSHNLHGHHNTSNNSKANHEHGGGKKDKHHDKKDKHHDSALILGPNLVGEKLVMKDRLIQVQKQLGEGGFSFVYLVKDMSSNASGNNSDDGSASEGNHNKASNIMVLKITSIQNREQREIAEREALLLRKLSHPSIVSMFDVCYRCIKASPNDEERGSNPSSKQSKQSAQHMILMEHCEDGHALDLIQKMKSAKQHLSLQSLIIAFGQICNAVSYLHAQKPPIVHRDLKLENFLVCQRGSTYKVCDFGSAIFGHVTINNSKNRNDAEETIRKTTTQIYRAPEMVDLYMTDALTQSTDVWALGCCLYAMAFTKYCFEEGSNLAILSKNYKIPTEHPYTDDLVELIDRMLTVDCHQRADMTEVITCLSALYSSRPLPPRKKSHNKKAVVRGESSKNMANNDNQSGDAQDYARRKERVGTFRTDGQGIIQHDKNKDAVIKNKQSKKLNPNSVAARRKAGKATSSSAAQRVSPKKSSHHTRNTSTSTIGSIGGNSIVSTTSNNKGVFDTSFDNDTFNFKAFDTNNTNNPFNSSNNRGLPTSDSHDPFDFKSLRRSSATNLNTANGQGEQQQQHHHAELTSFPSFNETSILPSSNHAHHTNSTTDGWNTNANTTTTTPTENVFVFDNPSNFPDFRRQNRTSGGSRHSRSSSRSGSSSAASSLAGTDMGGESVATSNISMDMLSLDGPLPSPYEREV